jgi:hypothetical protein
MRPQGGESSNEHRRPWKKSSSTQSKPVHGTLSRKLRGDIAIQVNEGEVYNDATLFIGEAVRPRDLA